MNWSQPSWFKPGAWGAVVGGIVTMVVGFSWGGWTTSGTTEQIARDRSTAAVTAALVPVCLEKSKADPAMAKKIGALRALTSSYEQRNAVVKDGWATVGAGEANSDVAEGCASEILKVAAK